MQPDALVVPKPVRCAIYTRKSTDDGLEQDFNSLDAQRECAEAYILSQRHEQWIALDKRYDDGGFTGANIDRPALRQLLLDVEAGLLDVVVVYKVDRLSRSLLDFARIMEVFDKRNVSFVSVSQPLNTTSSMGRLTLNVLLSFAQFEREIISERTRDKMIAARRKGKWTGGFPALGYDVDVVTRKLVINEPEASQVLQIFATFLRTGSLAETLEELNQKGFTTKTWTTRKSNQRTGTRFDRRSLTRVLGNILYIGEVAHGGSRYPGEQAAIIERAVWERAKDFLQDRKRGFVRERKKQSPILEQRLFCAICSKVMTHGYTTKDGRRYRYYQCQTARKGGAKSCPGQIVPAYRMEHAVRTKLLEVAGEPGWKALNQALRLHPSDWTSLSNSDQHRVLDALVDSMQFDHRSEETVVRLKPLLANEAGVSQFSVSFRKDPSGRQQSMPPTLPQEPALPRITRLLALAFRFEKLLEEGVVRNYPELARRAGVSISRVSQILKLRNLAPEIQDRILTLSGDHRYLSESEVRRVSQEIDWTRQLVLFDQLQKAPTLPAVPGVV
jgi:DNA invertase Pin-like site-specific DNA recombinase